MTLVYQCTACKCNYTVIHCVWKNIGHFDLGLGFERGQGQGLTTLVKRRAASLHQLSFLFLPENLTIPCFDKRLGLGVIKFHSLGVIGGNRAVSWVPPELSIR